MIDGSGRVPFEGDVAVRNGKITEIGHFPEATAAWTVDAAGCLVTPGFVDVHRHADAALFRPGFGEIELRQGITAIVNGNCGLSIAPAPAAYQEAMFDFLRPITGPVDAALPYESFGEYMSLAAKQTPPLHVGCCVGNGALRMAVKGFATGPLGKQELSRLHRLLEDALSAGALGVSMGIAYMPESCYDLSGFLEALAPIRGLGIPLVTHMRGEGNLLHDAIREVLAVAEALEAPLHISHFKSVGRQNWGHGVRGGLALLEEARNRGITVTCDVYPYTAGSSQLIQLLPPEFLEGGTDSIVARLRDPDSRKQLADILGRPQTRFENLALATGWENILLTTLGREHNKPYLGKSIAETAALRGREPLDCVCDLLIEERCDIAMVGFYMAEEDVRTVMRNPHSFFISDALYPAEGLPHPRLYGAFPRILAKYVREDAVIPLPLAIRKMTALPARLYKLDGKGQLAAGYDADINIFRLEDIKSPATYTEPRQLGQGMRHVFVAGESAVEQDQRTASASGSVLRRK